MKVISLAQNSKKTRKKDIMQMLNVSPVRRCASPARMLGAACVLCLILMTGGARAQQLVLTPSSSFATVGQMGDHHAVFGRRRE